MSLTVCDNNQIKLDGELIPMFIEQDNGKTVVYYFSGGEKSVIYMPKQKYSLATNYPHPDSGIAGKIALENHIRFIHENAMERHYTNNIE